MIDFYEYSELYHYGVKGMHWGVRRYQNPDGTRTAAGKIHNAKEKLLDEAGNFLGKDSNVINKATKTNGKLRKAYFDMQRAGVKYKKGKHVYADKKNDPEKYKAQRALQAKAKRYVNEYIKANKDVPMSYLQSTNAQKGAVIGAVVGAVLPVVGGWMTIPAGYVVGSQIGKKK